MNRLTQLGGLLAVLAAPVVSASPIVVLSENFEDPSYSTTTSLHLVAPGRFKRSNLGLADTTFVVVNDDVPGGLNSGNAMVYTAGVAGAGTAREILRVTGTPAVLVQDGDRINLSFRFRSLTIPNTPDNAEFRFGLSYSFGTDQGNPYPDPMLIATGAADDRVLFNRIDVGPRTSSRQPVASVFRQLASDNSYHLAGPNGPLPGGFLNLNAANNGTTLTGFLPPAASGFVNDTLPRLVEAELLRTSATGLTYTIRIDSVLVLERIITGVSDTANFLTSIDQVAFGAGIGAAGNPTYLVDDVVLSYTPIPEPAAASVLALFTPLMLRRR
ncbi:MAG: hypothetical protein ACK4PI_04325 [Tepidisphaerales bacterium]